MIVIIFFSTVHRFLNKTYILTWNMEWASIMINKNTSNYDRILGDLGFYLEVVNFC